MNVHETATFSSASFSNRRVARYQLLNQIDATSLPSVVHTRVSMIIETLRSSGSLNSFAFSTSIFDIKSIDPCVHMPTQKLVFFVVKDDGIDEDTEVRVIPSALLPLGKSIKSRLDAS